MPAQALPTKDDFVANHLEAIQHCDICHEPFDEEHVATRIRGLNQCQHIFGSTCLQKWIDSNSPQANSCPKCREVLFIQPAARTTFVAGMRASNAFNYLENINSLEHRWLFVNTLREVTSLWALNIPVTYDSDLEGMVNCTLIEVSKKYPQDFVYGPFVRPDNLLALREVAREMMMSPLDDGYVLPPDDRTINAAWFSGVAGVLGWNLQ